MILSYIIYEILGIERNNFNILEYYNIFCDELFHWNIHSSLQINVNLIMGL